MGDYDRILFYEVVTMNLKEWFMACTEGWAPRRYDNASREIQKSLKYNPNANATVRHHLRDTEEQRKYNDEHYELWGFEIDEDGNEHFEYGKYIIFVTPEEHTEIHSCSEETRKKLSDSLKGIPRTDEWKLKLSKSNKGKHNLTEEQRLQISKSVKEYYEQDGSREKTSRSTKEAMQRPEVRQRLIDGCKKRPPQSKESRQKVAEANKGKHHSDETKSFLSTNKREYYQKLHAKQASEFDLNLELSNLEKRICEKYEFSNESIRFIFSSILSHDNLDRCNNASTAVESFNIVSKTLPIKWNVFQSIFFSIRKLCVRSLFYEQYK